MSLTTTQGSSGEYTVVEIFPLLFAIPIILVGAWGVRTNGRKLSLAWTARGTSLSDISALRPDSQWVKVEGTVRAIEDDTFDAVASDSAVVVRVMTLEKRERSKGPRHSRNRRRTTWKSKGRRVDAVPFYVEDETGTARVEIPVEEVDTNYQLLTPGHKPNTTSIMLSSDRVGVSGGWARSVVDEQFEHELDTDGTYRIREGVLTPGETAYIAGWTRPGEGWSDEDITITGEPNPNKMIVADKSESAAESWSFAQVTAGTTLSLMFLSGGGLLLAIGLGLV